MRAKKSEEFSEWYSEVVQEAGLAGYAPIKGFVYLLPYGYELWELIRSHLDRRFKETNHSNAFLPLLIPESLLRKEAEHFKGFTPEVFWVTMSGGDQLSERLAVRPTSETLFYSTFGKSIKSWRELPVLVNFWNSALRAEIKSTKPFIRTSEFLWQEGHTLHATKEEADEEVMRMLNIYKEVIEEKLAIPVIDGYKSELEKFVGALYTTTLEAVMPDGKILQMATSHNLGQNFTVPFEVRYLGPDGQMHYAWSTSWGVSWRLIGAVIMVHGDDRGLVLPPEVAPTQVVVIPIFYSDAERESVIEKCREIVSRLRSSGVRTHLDDRTEYTPGWKFNEWELKGVPVRVEIGPRDLSEGKVTLFRRDELKRSRFEDRALETAVKELLSEVQQNLFRRARELLNSKISEARSMEEFVRVLEEKEGFVKATYCGSNECELRIKDLTGATVRVIPFEREPALSRCIACGSEGSITAYFGRAY
ncbi:MAG: proline--tRNA ligase [Thaumarchaeota archaeon]|nr:proline--tRNA ligase [Candidatus Calditenuaceae archaeon]MDW8186617.1 proline--tRNA ligase [Nitrososphaerota archaeon]